ncbi:MAG: ubiquinone biosynthesis regulatory protein kinase UbiB [SAR86 cluster bacterium]|uniref:Ubiquinone biosynthesis regulatory protein kinase UbiB n=1 Tax=SAR86 cluster bacterium TaxID=2030880 RepID=A0A2A4MGT0_9GAMM|nr:MAG: ubiquinone biosynthesis regulatory protein kinase UbiB [SAR86 cluster bacterium]
MSPIPRLIKVLNIVAKYRLHDFLQDQAAANSLRLLLRGYGATWSVFGTPAVEKDAHRNRRLRLALEELGPIYIKFGQLLSTRRDFLDTDLADELSGLQDDVPPFTTSGIVEIVEQSLGLSVDEVFDDLSIAPLASASVAQVHSAKLKNGDEVVVKVIRPGIEKTINADLKLLKWIAKVVESRLSFGKRLRSVEVVNDYEQVILDELNLLSEAANTTQLKHNFQDSNILYVPKIYWDFCRENVMVAERIYGIPVSNVEQLNAAGVNMKKLAETGVEIFFTQVFNHSFFHADMHPGNIFVDAKDPENPQYIAIDCAIIGSLSDDDQQYLARNLLAIFKRDYRRVAQLHVECGWVPKQTNIHQFETAMRSVCEPIFEKPLKDISFGLLLVQLFSTASKFEMEVQPSLVLLQKTLLNVEGLGRELYPELDLWQTALPFLESWNKKRLNPLTLAAKLAENIPNWIEQLPQLPQLMIDTLNDSKQLAKINETLLEQQQQHRQHLTNSRRALKLVGGCAFAGALLSLYPPVAQAMVQLPSISLSLAIIGVVFLCFRR